MFALMSGIVAWSATRTDLDKYGPPTEELGFGQAMGGSRPYENQHLSPISHRSKGCTPHNHPLPFLFCVVGRIGVNEWQWCMKWTMAHPRKYVVDCGLYQTNQYPIASNRFLEGFCFLFRLCFIFVLGRL